MRTQGRGGGRSACTYQHRYAVSARSERRGTARAAPHAPTHLSLQHTAVDVVGKSTDVDLHVLQRFTRATDVEQRLASIEPRWIVVRALAGGGGRGGHRLGAEV